MQYFNIQVASQLSGVASATIRAWEKRYNAVVPERANNKHRLYSDKDIEKLAVLFRLTEIGQSIGKIAHLELEKLKEIYTSLLHKPYDLIQIVTTKHERVNFSDVIRNILVALGAYRVEILAHELEKIFSTLPPKDICLNLLLPLYQDLNDKIKNEVLSFSHKEILDELIIFQIGQLIREHYQSHLPDRDLILMASTPNNKSINLYLDALLLIQTNANIIFLGRSVLPKSLADTITSLNPQIIILSINDVIETKDFLNEIHLQSKHSPQFWIEGEMDTSSVTELEKMNCLVFTRVTELNKSLLH